MLDERSFINSFWVKNYMMLFTVYSPSDAVFQIKAQLFDEKAQCYKARMNGMFAHIIWTGSLNGRTGMPSFFQNSDVKVRTQVHKRLQWVWG